MRRGQDLAHVRARGTRFRGEFVELRVVSADDGETRIGIVVPRHSRSAVARNRIKRCIRELARIERAMTPLPGDVVITALPGAYEASAHLLRREIVTLWTRAAAQR